MKVKAFPGASALPLIVGTTQGFYEKHGLKVELLFTQNSQEQRDDLAKGAVQIAHAAVDNAVALERYIAGYIEATRWTVAPEHRAAAAKLLVERFKVDPKVSERTLELLSDPKFGLARDAAFDLQGFRNVLALRAEIEGDWGGRPPPPEKFIDLRYYQNALARLSR